MTEKDFAMGSETELGVVDSDSDRVLTDMISKIQKVCEKSGNLNTQVLLQTLESFAKLIQQHDESPSSQSHMYYVDHLVFLLEGMIDINIDPGSSAMDHVDNRDFNLSIKSELCDLGRIKLKSLARFFELRGDEVVFKNILSLIFYLRHKEGDEQDTVWGRRTRRRDERYVSDNYLSIEDMSKLVPELTKFASAIYHRIGEKIQMPLLIWSEKKLRKNIRAALKGSRFEDRLRQKRPDLFQVEVAAA